MSLELREALFRASTTLQVNSQSPLEQTLEGVKRPLLKMYIFLLNNSKLFLSLIKLLLIKDIRLLLGTEWKNEIEKCKRKYSVLKLKI